jgi:hypothetical protein
LKCELADAVTVTLAAHESVRLVMVTDPTVTTGASATSFAVVAVPIASSVLPLKVPITSN